MNIQDAAARSRAREAAAHPASRINRPVSKRRVSTLDPAELPDIYAMGLSGDCMMPELRDGCFVKISKSEPFAPGDFVIVYSRPELVPAGHYQGMVKRLVMAPPPWVTFPWRETPKSEIRALVVCEQLNPPRRYHIPCDELIGIHKVLGEVGRDEVRIRMSDDEIRAMNR